MEVEIIKETSHIVINDTIDLFVTKRLNGNTITYDINVLENNCYEINLNKVDYVREIGE